MLYTAFTYVTPGGESSQQADETPAGTVQMPVPSTPIRPVGSYLRTGDP